MFARYLPLLCLMFPVGLAQAGSAKWEANIPSVARAQGTWADLARELPKQAMFFGAMAASARMLVLFQDLQSKEAAYKTIMDLATQGYPFPIQPFFLTGDLSPSGEYDFVNNYNLYKFILNREKGMDKWAQYYLQNVDRENFPKYLFSEALESYAKRDLKNAEEILRKILGREFGAEQGSFVSKVTRTLARIFFDKEEYDKAYDIYVNFLLKLNPVVSSDFVEAAWSLYYLHRYHEALGMLYNLESRSKGAFMNLEKYTIRALSYRNLCAVSDAEALIESFDRDFGQTVTALKRGEPAHKFPELSEIEVPENLEYRQMSISINALRAEAKGIELLPEKLRALAAFLYNTEISMLTQRRKGYSEAAMEAASRKLIMMREHLRFLSFDVQQQKFNPDAVFKPVAEHPLVEDLPDNGTRIRWKQYGDFWRDERLKYRAAVLTRCSE